MGGVLALSAILALSLTFASCANNSDTNSDNGNNTGITDNNNSNDSNGTNNENPSPTLPSNVGKNPITKTIRLNFDKSARYLELRTDGTALEIYVDDDDKNSVEETVSKYKYTYDAEKKTITMILEKHYYEGFFTEEDLQLLTYDELCSKVDKEFAVEKLRQYEKEYYEEEKESTDFKDDYPDCNSYDDYEAALVKENGFSSFADLVEYQKQIFKNDYKAYFGAQITYAYKIENDKMTLTEKFTGVKNLFYSECEFDEGSSYGDISCNWASINIQDNDRYSGPVDTDKKTISFVSRADRKKVVEGTYTENISAGTVTIKFKDKEYLCEFEGDEYIQVE